MTMRRLGWGLVVGGLVLAVLSVVYSVGATRANVRAWHEEGLRSTSVAELTERMRLVNAGLVPRWTQVAAWPGVLLGFGMAGVGVVVLAVRKPGG